MTLYLVVAFQTYSGTLPISPRTWAVLVAGFFTFLPISLEDEAVRRRSPESLRNTHATDRNNLFLLQLPHDSLQLLRGVAQADQ